MSVHVGGVPTWGTGLTPREWVSGQVTYLPTGEDITRLLAVEKAVASWNRRFAL